MSDVAFALRSAADEWADQGCLATADLMREAAERIADLDRVVEMQREMLAALKVAHQALLNGTRTNTPLRSVEAAIAKAEAAK